MPGTWVLIVWLFAGHDRFRGEDQFDVERTPGLSKSVCYELAWQVDPAQGFAKCIGWGQPMPYWPPWLERPKSPPIRDRSDLPGRRRV
jgi:hypothetical protein